MMQESQHHDIEIGHRTIIFSVLFLLSLFALWRLSNILIGLFISYLMMAAVNPLVTLLERHRIPRQISALFIMLSVVTLFVSGIAALVPPVIDQTSSFLAQLPHLLKSLGVELDQTLISSQLGSIPQNIFRIASGIFSNALAVFTTLVISYYLLLERQRFPKRLKHLFSDGEEEAERLLVKIEERLGGWLRGQVVLCAIIGITVYAGLLALSIPYAVPLAIIGGILEMVPNIGPTISTIPAAIVGFTISPIHGGAVILLYFLIQQLENNFIVPMVMKKAVGLNPLVTLVSLMVGYTLGGVTLAVLAIPIVVVAQVLFPYFYRQTQKL